MSHNISSPIQCTPYVITGQIIGLKGMLIHVVWGVRDMRVGQLCRFMTTPPLTGEIVGFEGDHALVLPYGSTTGLSSETPVLLDTLVSSHVMPHNAWLGRVLNGWANPIDHKGALPRGEQSWALQGESISASERMRVHTSLDVGIRSINTFLTIAEGQRIGLFSGTGVGKSVLLSMLARFTPCQVCVIGLIGERGREVREFLEETLTEEVRRNSVVVVATGDEPPLLRRRAAYLTMTLTEYFRAQGLSVLCLLDSITRFAMALRDIGLALGEPPTLRGYPPSTFAELPRLLERAGPSQKGHTTGFFTVLIEGDNHQDPIMDTVRGILDGHIMLDRALAERGHFPAIQINQSTSRLTHVLQTPEQQELVQWGRKQLALYDEMLDLIRINAYQEGSNAEVDTAIAAYPLLMQFLAQNWRTCHHNISDNFAELEAIYQKIVR